MPAPSDGLLDAVAALARSMSAGQVLAVAALIESVQEPTIDAVVARLGQAVPQANLSHLLAHLAAEWAQTGAPPSEVAAMLRAASRSVQAERAAQSVGLVWTGPEPAAGSFRRTDQALCELIEGARRSVLIVSFAVHMVPAVAAALQAAARRGVAVDICIDAPEAGAATVAYDTVRALGSAVRAIANVYVWPVASRPRSATGSPAALHAKCAVADDNVLLVSSANLTNNAMSVNLELGVLVRGGVEPGRVAKYFRTLIARGVLVGYSSPG